MTAPRIACWATPSAVPRGPRHPLRTGRPTSTTSRSPASLHLVFVRSTVAHAELATVDTSAAAGMPGVAGVFTAADLDVPVAPGLMVREPGLRPSAAGQGQGPLRRRHRGRGGGREPGGGRRRRRAGRRRLRAAPRRRRSRGGHRAGCAAAVRGASAPTSPPAAGRPTTTTRWPAPTSSSGAGSRTSGWPCCRWRATPSPSCPATTVARGGWCSPRTSPSTSPPRCPTAGGTRRSTCSASTLPGCGSWPPTSAAPSAARSGWRPSTSWRWRWPCRLGRPVKWVESRSENLVAMPHGRGQVQYVELGLRHDGTIVGLRCRILGDAGAYAGFGGGLAGWTTKLMAQGPYRIPRIGYDVASVVTNTTPMGAFRGAGRPEAAAFLERILDMAADELGIDPAEIRRRNFLPADAFPHKTVMGATYDSGDYDAALTEALRLAGYEQLRAEQAERRRRGDRLLLGIGLAAYVEITAGGNQAEWGSVEVHTDGTVTVKVGTSAHGQGHATAFSTLVADRLRVPLEAVRFVQSDTAARAERRRHRRVPLAAARRQRRGRSGRRGGGRRAGPGRPAARGQRGRHRPLRGRAPRRGRRPGPGPVVGRPGGGRGEAGNAAARRAGLHAGGSDVPLRRPRGGGGGRYRDRAGAARPPRRGRRLRTGPQPPPRRRPAARRHRPGARPGAVGGRRLRRGRQPADGHAGRLRPAQRGRAAVVRGVGNARPPRRSTPSAPRASASRARLVRCPPSRMR